jgi:hypothetical protein
MLSSVKLHQVALTAPFMELRVCQKQAQLPVHVLTHGHGHTVLHPMVRQHLRRLLLQRCIHASCNQAKQCRVACAAQQPGCSRCSHSVGECMYHLQQLSCTAAAGAAFSVARPK